jgi:hypothetical protein
MACDAATNTCTTACTDKQTCHAGCCNAGTCDLGTTDAICGGVTPGYVGTCFSCATSRIGGHCKNGGVSYKCGGCASPADCKGGGQCVGGKCCLPKGGVPEPMHPEQCCSDVISSGVCY